MAFFKGQENGGVKGINPSTSPSLKSGISLSTNSRPRVQPRGSGLILSGAFDPILKDGVWRCRSIKVEGGMEKAKEVIVCHEVVSSKWKKWNHDNFLRDWNKNDSV